MTNRFAARAFQRATRVVARARASSLAPASPRPFPRRTRRVWRFVERDAVPARARSRHARCCRTAQWVRIRRVHGPKRRARTRTTPRANAEAHPRTGDGATGADSVRRRRRGHRGRWRKARGRRWCATRGARCRRRRGDGATASQATRGARRFSRLSANQNAPDTPTPAKLPPISGSTRGVRESRRRFFSRDAVAGAGVCVKYQIVPPMAAATPTMATPPQIR